MYACVRPICWVSSVHFLVRDFFVWVLIRRAANVNLDLARCEGGASVLVAGWDGLQLGHHAEALQRITRRVEAYFMCTACSIRLDESVS